MSSKKLSLRILILSLALGMFVAAPAFAGSAVVGSVAGSMNATVSGHAVPAGYTVFSGDSLKVRDGSAILAVGKGSRMVFGRFSEVSFARDADSITATLTSGNVSLFRPSDEPTAVRVKVGNVTIEPASGFKTLGEVALLSDVAVVSSKEGLMKLSWPDGKTMDVPQGKAVKLAPKNNRAPQAAGGSQHFGTDWDRTLEVVAIGAGTIAAIFAGLAWSRSNDALDAANAAEAQAAAAAAAAAQANATALALLCAWHKIYPASPFTIPAGESCP